MVAWHVALEADLLAGALGRERHQPRALAVNEDDQRGRRLLQRLGERGEVGRLGHHEGVLEGHAHVQDLAQPRRPAREHRHSAGPLEALLAHQGLALRLDPL